MLKIAACSFELSFCTSTAYHVSHIKQNFLYYRCMQNLVRFLGFAESPTKISGKSPKVQNKKTEIVKSTPLPPPMP